MTVETLLRHGLVPRDAAEALMPELREAAKGIPLRNRQKQIVAYAMVDTDDYERVSAHRWYMTPEGYVVRSGPKINGKQKRISLHREVTGCRHGDGRMVDHQNHDTLDNRKSNLRFVTHAENHQNRKACGDRNASSQYRGVSFAKKNGKWHAYGCLNGEFKHLGFYEDEQEAADVAAAWREEHMPFTTN